MKHYAKFKGGDEYDLINPRTRRYVCHSHEWLADTKHRYRKRERAILKRMTAELVAYELDGYRDDERAYWMSAHEAARHDYDDLWSTEERLRNSGRWVEEYTPLFARAYREARERADAAYDEYLAA
jgi:hypothetical protein